MVAFKCPYGVFPWSLVLWRQTQIKRLIKIPPLMKHDSITEGVRVLTRVGIIRNHYLSLFYKSPFCIEKPMACMLFLK